MSGRYLSPTIDLVFKKLFGTVANKDLTISLLNGILNLPKGKLIVELTHNDPSNHLEMMQQKHSIVDVRCTDECGHKYIIEMQNDDYHNFAQRAQYYGSCGLSSQLKVAEEYGVLLPVIFVGIVSFSLFPRHKRYITNHVILDKEDLCCDLDLTTFHFIELPKFKKKENQLETLVDKWIYFIKYASEMKKVPEELKTSKTFTHAFQVLTQSAWTEQEMALYQAQVDARRVEVGVLETAERKGEMKGREEGRKEGREEGREEALFAIARNMLAKKMGIEDIAQVTGLDVVAIKKLKN